MKNSIIKQIFYGQRGNSEKVPLGEEYNSLIDKIIENENKMDELIKNSPAVLKQYKKTCNLIERLHCASCDEHYIEGFKIGLLLGFEIFADLK